MGETIEKSLLELDFALAGLTGSAAGRTGSAAAEGTIDDDFILEVEALMTRGTSALFVLDQESDMATILQAIQGLGGTVLETNVDLDE